MKVPFTPQLQDDFDELCQELQRVDTSDDAIEDKTLQKLSMTMSYLSKEIIRHLERERGQDNR